MAEALYITDKAVSKWERGLACPDISLLQSLAQILGVSVVELLNGEKADAVDVGAVLQSSIETYVEENKKVRIKRFVAIMMVLALVIGGVLLRHGMRLAEETRVELQCVCDNVNHRLPEILTAVLEAEEPFENTAEYISLKTSIDSEWRTIIELQFLLDYDAETYKQCTELSRP